MLKEYDSVVAKKDLGDVPKGTKGVIVIVYPGKRDFEVEFFDAEGNTLCVITVNEMDIENRTEDLRI